MTILTVPKHIAETLFAGHTELDPYATERYWRDVDVSTVTLSDQTLNDLRDTAGDTKDDKTMVRLLDAVLAARAGDTGKIGSLPTLAQVMPAWVNQHCAEGWLVRKTGSTDEYWLPTQVRYREPSQNSHAHTTLTLTANSPGIGPTRRGERVTGRTSTTVTFNADDLTTTLPSGKRRRRTVTELLEAHGLFPATKDDIAQHDRIEQRYEEVLATGFAQQYLHTGDALDTQDSWRGPHTNTRAKVIHDIKASERVPAQPVATVWGTGDGPHAESAILRRVPTQPTLRVFDLPRQVYALVDVRDLTEYTYDASLRDKLVLPGTHRDLLDVLTTDLADYSDDIIDGKSAGNVILAQGRPGVGKTLTAEVYSELVQRPLYSIHSGSLGVDAKSVRENLEAIFARAARWDAVLLLDEADVFVIERGTSIEQNAIVAEFLRTLEYFKGLLFMTTNRSDQIDDAILSRCAAIIAYDVPERDDARKVWNVMIHNAGADNLIDDDLVETLLDTYPQLAPRDIKMVLRLALRIAAKHGGKPDLDTFANCILFRGLTAADA